MMHPIPEKSDVGTLLSSGATPSARPMATRNDTDGGRLEDTAAVDVLVRRYAMPKAQPVAMPTQEIRFWTLRTLAQSLTAALSMRRKPH